MYCIHCGQKLDATARFCSACGSATEEREGVRTPGADGGAWGALSVGQRRGILIVVCGVLVVTGFLASFGKSSNGFYGTESMSGAEFAASAPSRWARYAQEEAGMQVNWSNGPSLKFAYMLPLAGVALSLVGISMYGSSTRQKSIAALLLSLTCGSVTAIAWWSYISFYGTDDAMPAIGTYLAVLAAAMAALQAWPGAALVAGASTPAGSSKMP